MTREEAIKRIENVGYTYGNARVLFDALIALDLLKVEEPRSSEDQAFHILANTVGLSVEAATKGLRNLKSAGLKIVKADTP